MKKLTMPLLLIFALMLAPSVSAQTYTLEPGDIVTHDGEDYTITELVEGHTCKIYYDGVESSSLVVGDNIGNLQVTVISTYVRLESIEGEEPYEPSELRYKLDSGDVLLFSDASGVNGAMGYVYGEAIHPTFQFWSGGNIPSISKTPTPQEKITLRIGDSHTTHVIFGGLTITVEDTDADKVTVLFGTDDSISLMSTSIGTLDITEIIESLWLDWQSQLPAAETIPPSAPVDLSGITFALTGFLCLGVFWMGMKWYTGWGERW